MSRKQRRERREREKLEKSKSASADQKMGQTDRTLSFSGLKPNVLWYRFRFFYEAQSFSLFVIATFVPAFLIRLYHLPSFIDNQYDTGPLWIAIIRGLVSDAFVSIIVASAFLLLFAWLFRSTLSKTIFAASAVLALVSAFIHAGNSEHIHFNFANTNFFFAKYGASKELLLGSIFTQTVFAKTATAFGAALVLLFVTVKVSTPKLMRFVPYKILVYFVAWLLLPSNVNFPNWVRYNVLEENFRSAISRSLEKAPEFSENTINESTRSKFLSYSLDGEPIIELPDKDKNILIIVLEGMGKKYLKHTPFIRSLANQSIYTPNFITHQRQTNRGMYALMCGDYPNLAHKESKSDLMGVFGARTDCFPKVLTKNGYETVFMQGADLGFMRKDLFAKAAGFQEIKGNRNYRVAKSRSGWGVDDMTLFDEAAKRIKKFSGPWMMTLLTVGTHPPYNVPQSYLKANGRKEASFADALSYMDQSLGKLLGWLKRTKRLDNTLVIVTTDEVGEADSNEGILYAMPPKKVSARHESKFSQADLQASVLDFLGIQHDSRFGRSFFRKYSSERPILFANTYTDRVSLSLSKDSSISCSSDFKNCQYHTGLEAKGGKPVPADPREVQEFKEIVEYNDLSTWDLKQSTTIYRESGTQYQGNHRILGGHLTWAKERDRVLWEMKIRASKKNTSMVLVKFITQRSDPEKKWVRIADRHYGLAPGQQLDFHRGYLSTKGDRQVKTDVIISGSPDIVTHIEDFKLSRFPKGTYEITKFHKKIYGTIPPVKMNLLKNDILTDCVKNSLRFREPVRANQCKLKERLFNTPGISARVGQRMKIRYVIDGIKGKPVFISDLVRFRKTLESQGPMIVPEGKRGVFEFDYTVPYHGAPVATRITLFDAKPTDRFIVREATLEIVD